MNSKPFIVERALVNSIGRVFRLPAAVLVFACLTFMLFCYFVAPAQIGVILVIVAAPLPWYEERLKRRIGPRGTSVKSLRSGSCP